MIIIGLITGSIPKLVAGPSPAGALLIEDAVDRLLLETGTGDVLLLEG